MSFEIVHVYGVDVCNFRTSPYFVSLKGSRDTGYTILSFWKNKVSLESVSLSLLREKEKNVSMIKVVPRGTCTGLHLN